MSDMSDQSEFNLNLRITALACECRQDTRCAIHALSTIPGGMRARVEESVYSRLAVHITQYTKFSIIRTMVESCPIDAESRNKVYRLLCALRSDMTADALKMHNEWYMGVKSNSALNHQESTCRWCLTPKKALSDFLAE